MNEENEQKMKNDPILIDVNDMSTHSVCFDNC